MDYKRKLYVELANTIQARTNCINSGNAEWRAKHTDTINQIVRDLLPSGSGWDCGTKIDLDSSTGEKIVLYGSWHHMNDGGYYTGWTEHIITVRPSLTSGISLSISGRDRNDVKEFLYQMFDDYLRHTIDYVDGNWRRL